MCDYPSASYLLQQSGFTDMLVPLALMFVIFYFLLIRPQSKERKQQAAMRAALGKGDKVLTQGGIVAKIRDVREHEVVLDLDGAKLRVVRDAVVRVLDEGSGSSKDSAKTASPKEKAAEQAS